MKVKELHQKEIEQEQNEQISFAEWLEYFKQKPTNNTNFQGK